VTVAESGTATFAAAGDIVSDGAVSLTATGGITTAGDITTTNDSITYVSATTLTGSVAVNAGAGGIAFNSTLNGPFSLQANSTANTTFIGLVGGSTPLASLITDAGGITAINGGGITTSGLQTYNDAVTLDAAGNATTLTGTDITFVSTVRSTADGQEALTVTGSGTTTFNAAVGDNSQRLAALTANGGGMTTFNGNVTTTGAQTYNDSIRIDTDLAMATTNSLMAFANTLDSQVLETNDLTINTGTAAVTFGGAIGGAVNGALGTLTINNSAVAGLNLPATTLSGALNVTTAGPITDYGASTVTGTTTLAAGPANSITLDNANNFSTVVITSGNNVTLVDTNALDLGASTVSGALTLTTGSHITQTGVLNVTGLTTVSVTNPLTDILLGTQANDLGTLAPVFTGTTANVRDVSLRNINPGAATSNFNGLTNLRNLTLIYNNAPVNLSGLTASGTLDVNAGGAITDSGPSIVPGLSIFNANGFDIVLNDPGNNFGTVQLAGAAITLFNVTSVNLAGVQATGVLNLQSAGSLTVSSAMTSNSSVSLSSTSGDLLINAPVSSSGGNLTLSAGQNVTATASGTLTTAGGSVTVGAGANAQLADIASSGGAVTVTPSGSATFISPLTITGAFLVNAGGDVTYDQALNGGGTLTVNTTGVTRFSAAISGLNSLITNAGGSTVLAGGALGVSGSFRFDDPVTLAAATVITGPTGRFNSTLDGGQALTVNLTGDALFMDAVGGGQRLASITAGPAGTMGFYGGSALTTGPQVYDNAVSLGATTIFGASALTFNNTVNRGPARSTVAPLSDGGFLAISTDSGLTANVTGATIFNAAVGQAADGRLGDVTINGSSTDGSSTAIRANFSAASITVNNPLTFDIAPSITVDTTDSQNYTSSVTLGTDLTFNSTLAATFPSTGTATPEGINFAQGIDVTGTGLTLTVTAPGSTLSVGGDLSDENTRFDSISAAGRYMVMGGNVWAQGDIALAIGTATEGENDFLQFTGPAGSTQHTLVDSVDGEIILGSGATGTAEKTAAPARGSVFKSNDGDLYLFARKVTVQPFERLVVRHGSLIVIADGTAAEDGITMSSTAASNYLILVSSTERTVPGISLRSRGPANIDQLDGTLIPDQGTDLIAGAVFFFNVNHTLPGTVPTREAYAPAPATEAGFDYELFTGNILSAFGPVTINILPDDTGTVQNVYVADLVLSNRFRPVRGNLIYLDLSTAPGFGEFLVTGFIDPDSIGLAIGAPMRTLVSVGAAPRAVLQSAFTPNVPREDRETAPPEVDLAPAVREQLQALGIYARALRTAERISRERRRGLFTTIPERERPRESDYEVADARVEDRSVREVIRLATTAGLIGEDQHKLDDVARSLAVTYEAFTAVSSSIEARDFRSWLEASKEADAVRVLEYLKTLSETLNRIELLGLTRQELGSSKAQIYGSILRARLNTDPEFLRLLVEGSPTADLVASSDQPSGRPDALALAAPQ
jgi:hypothetical protein